MYPDRQSEHKVRLATFSAVSFFLSFGEWPARRTDVRVAVGGGVVIDGV